MSAVSVLTIARSYVGYREGYNNDTIFGRRYVSDGSFNHTPWCDEFITFCGIDGNEASAVGHFAYTPSHVQWFKNNNQWHLWSEKAQPGDIVFYNWDGIHTGEAQHVGFVESLTGNTQNPNITIEGNSEMTGGDTSEGVGVFRHNRSIQRVIGYGRPAYANAPVTPTPASQEPPTQADHGSVYLSKLHVGQTDSDSVRRYQQALRDYPNIPTIRLSPHGVDGNYGSETVAMTDLVYRTFDRWQPGHGWADGNTSTPGRSLLTKLGLRIAG